MNKVQNKYDLRQYTEGFGQYGFHVNRGVLTEDFPKHTHDFYETAIVISGTAKHEVGEYTYSIKRGDVHVIKGDVLHGYSEVDNLEILDIMYYPHLFISPDFQLSNLPGFRSLFIFEPEIRLQNHYPFTLRLKDREMDYVFATTDFIMDEFREEKGEYHVVAKLSLIALFAYLSIKYEANSNESSASQILSKAIWIMRENLANQVKMSEIAAGLFISTRHFCRLFKEYFDCTPGDYLLNMRLKHALTLLSKYDMKIADVTEQCGFTDASYFARMFKKSFGITPKQAKLLEI